MRISDVASAEGGAVGSMRTGKLDQKFLLQGDDDSPNNYLLNVGLTGSGGWGTPRHRHNFDQIRYVLKGKYPASPHKIMGEGSVAYFPESVHYGPQDRPEGLEMMVIQFGGASGSGFLSTPRREAANEALKAKGEFKEGIFTGSMKTARSTTKTVRRRAMKRRPERSSFSRRRATTMSS